MKSGSRARLWLTLAIAALVVLAVGIALLRWGIGGLPGPGGPDLPGPGSETYRAMVSAFYAGVAALDVDTNDQAKTKLTRATELIPEEPAAWANRGLLRIRLRDYEAARQDLEHARTLAPESGKIEQLLGLLESQRGNSAAAIMHLHRAIKLDPENLRARFALAEEIERQGGPDAEVEPLRLLDEILKAEPKNPAVLLEQARLTAKAGDADALRNVVARLGTLASGWSEPAQKAYQALEQAAKGSNPRPVVPRILVLRNVLVTDPAFRRSLAAIQGPVGMIGEPLEHFLKLPSPSPTPAAPDEALSFAVEPVAGKGPWGSLVATILQSDGTPVLLAANGQEVRRIDDEKLTLPFPGGPEKTPPTPAGILAADWNADNALDLILAGAGGLRFFQQKEGSFTDVTKATELGPDVLDAATIGAWVADIEQDGDLDIVVGSRTGSPLVLQNHGDGTFGTLQPFEAVSGLHQFRWADLNQDGIPDAAFLDEKNGLRIFINERSGRFRERPALKDLGTIAALAIGDLDGDGVVDLVALRADGAIVRIWDQDHAWESAEVIRWQDPPKGDLRIHVADLDNNGGLDLIASGMAGSRAWLSDETGQFRALAAPLGLRVLDVADLNGDGRLDLAGLSEQGEAVRALGNGTKEYQWQVIQPRAAKVVGDGRINAFGIGGEVQVRAGLLVQKQVITGPTLHFGLGNYPGADVARVVWPNGTLQAEFDTQANQVIVAEQRLKGSCPFVYAHDGEGVKFVTDFLWRSPLGLRINAQDTAGVSQTEDWIKIRGDQLATREGYYDIRITAELWETHYFDHVSLMVVDHPEGSEVFVDERFARQPPALAVQATGPLLPLASARDDRGRDVTNLVRERDGRYLDTFGRGPYQGVTRDHWVEVELGDDIAENDRLILVAQGWIHPTDSSINVALAQGQHDPPKGLSLEVPTAEGDWIVARSDLGFPAGKDKTILIDLDGVFQPDAPRRFRLRTNLEIFWDALAVAVAGDEAILKTQRVAAATAELRPRGYSLMTQVDASSPERPDYDQIIGTTQRWRDLIGFYTRFGDVRELLAKVDDRYAIANAGDEVALRFPAPPSPPAGWTRDFVLIGDGWNKDGDYNTAFSKTVLPLPSHDRPNYDTPPGALEDDPVFRLHARDWEEYHTRYITPRVFQDGLRPRTATRPGPIGAR